MLPAPFGYTKSSDWPCTFPLMDPNMRLRHYGYMECTLLNIQSRNVDGQPGTQLDCPLVHDKQHRLINSSATNFLIFFCQQKHTLQPRTIWIRQQVV